MPLATLPTPTVHVALWDAVWSLWWPRGLRLLLLLLSDMTAILLAMAVGYAVWAGPVLAQPVDVWLDLLPLLGLFPLGYASVGLYPGLGTGAVERLRRLSLCTSFTFLVLITSGFVFHLTPRYSRIGFAIAWGLSLCAVPGLRLLLTAVAGPWQRWQEPVVLVGHAAWVQGAVQTFRQTPALGYRPVGILSPELGWQVQAIDEVPVLGDPALAPSLASGGVHVALVCEEDTGRPALSWLQEYFRRVVVVRDGTELPVELVRVCNLGGVLGIELRNNLLRWPNRCVKRLLDLVLGSLGLLLALPIILLGALLVRCASPGPLLFAQRRAGLHGRTITVWKLRTMFQDAEQRLDDFLATNPALRHEWETHCKLSHDPRVIPGIGAVLRRFSLDELPQLWSVVKGDMSLVGPRPFPAYHLARLPEDFCTFRQRVRPGLTGMWQVLVRSDGNLAAQQRYDTYYIRNWSLWLDVWILLHTLGVVLRHKGAY